MENQLKQNISESQLELRYRFEQSTNETAEEVINRFKLNKDKYHPDYIISIIENNVWIKIGAKNRQVYSPHLHLEVNDINVNKATIRCLFGPNPALWTMFMFLHFVVAGVFIIFSVIAYTRWKLAESMTSSIIIMILMTIVWFFLYFFARMNRKAGLPQAHDIQKVYEEILAS